MIKTIQMIIFSLLIIILFHYLYESLKTMFTKPTIKIIKDNSNNEELKSYLTSKINVLNTE